MYTIEKKRNKFDTVPSLSPDKAKRKRSKNYDPHDIELCYALMDEHDPTQLLASAKWAADARQLKEQILNTIYTNFVQRATAKTITLPQVSVSFHFFSLATCSFLTLLPQQCWDIKY